jgi:wyosine [tRNA(Phe)-imidazoG37] synthetase (radical SAM superfamily)
MTLERRVFYSPEEVLESVEEKLKEARKAGEPIDFLSFVPDGEPTLDVNLGRHIALLQPLGFPIAVISNASLIRREDVRLELAQADWVSLKVDAVAEPIWRRVNHPHGKLSLPAILEGSLAFAEMFSGKLVTETMLVADINDGEAELNAVADFLETLKPSAAYISVPIRPPDKTWVRSPDETRLMLAYQILAKRVREVEYLTRYEGEAFASLGNTGEALLGILAVHPMREDAVRAFLSRTGAAYELLIHLVDKGLVTSVNYQGEKFYIRRRIKPAC